MNLDSKVLYAIAGSPSEGYIDDVGRHARFRKPFGVASLPESSLTSMLVVDRWNHCIRLVNRKSNQTSTFSGECGINPSLPVDGFIKDAKFGRINDLVKNPTDPTLLYTYSENKRKIILLKINFPLEQSTVMMLEESDYSDVSMKSMRIKPDGNYIYIAFAASLYWFNLKTYKGSNTNMFADTLNDGPLFNAGFSSLNSVLFIDDQVILLSDETNNNFRILDLQNETISSVCKISKQRTETYIGEEISSCNVYKPRHLFKHPERELVLILSDLSILQLDYEGIYLKRLVFVLILFTTV